MSKFWDHYEAAVKPGAASVVDDVRHKLVEEAWFGRKVTGEIAETDFSTKTPDAEEVDAELVATEPTKLNSVGSFYSETRAYDARAIDLYGQTPTTQAAPAIEAPTQERGYEPEL